MTPIESFIELVISLISDNLYAGVFLAALIETVFPPIPSEVVFPLAGYLVLQNELPFFHVFTVGITGGAGSTVGGYVIYLIALKLGRAGLNRFAKYTKSRNRVLLKLKTGLKNMEINLLFWEDSFQELGNLYQFLLEF